MKFKKTAPDENYSIARLVDETGQWEFGMRRVLYGNRVACNRIGTGCYVADYCAADDQSFLLLLFAVMYNILEQLPPETTETELQRVLPRYDRKPINLDPCWQNLQCLAQILTEKPLAEIEPEVIFRTAL